MFLVVSAPLGSSYERIYTHAKRTLGRGRYTGVATSPNSRTMPTRAREAVTAARGTETQDRLSQPAEFLAASGKWAGTGAAAACC
jgi:hypothetical protein